MRRSALFILLAISVIHGAAQQAYFQQEVNYVIDVALDDTNHQLHGVVRMTYINHSSHTLQSIYLHHWPNAYSTTKSPLAKQLLNLGQFNFQFGRDEFVGYIDSLAYKVNGSLVFMQCDSISSEICRIDLPSPLLSDDSVQIETPFRVQIPPAEISRLGHDDQAYYISQWYPKPAVYDANGWNTMPYLSIGEFYSEFGKYEVNITLPENYVVMATGVLQNEGELEWLNQKAEKTAGINQFPDDMSFPPSSLKSKTLTYRQDNIHDFAWFADKRYHVLKGDVILPNSGDTVQSWSAFTNHEAHLWKNSIEYLNHAVHYYSQWLGDYPHKQVTAVDGVISAGAGMEYPMITIVGESGDPISLETVIAHEVGHNWFYGILASNERLHPWMDEGLNSAAEIRYLEARYPELSMAPYVGAGLRKFFRAHQLKNSDQNQLVYAFAARRNLDQPLSLQSTNFTSLNYFGIAYGKGALAFNYLRGYLGDKAFDQMMQSYFSDWKFKHPGPNDFFPYVTRALAYRDFWMDNLVYTTRKTDYKAAALKRKKNTYLLKVKSVGKVHGPVTYTLLNKENEILTEQWIEPFGRDTTIELSTGKFHRVVLDYERYTPDINRKNNQIRKGGILRKMEPLRFQWLTGVEEPERTTLYYTPIVGYNTTDQFMAGMLLHNHNLFQKRVEFKLAPMWAFGSERLNWMASMRYNYRFHQSRVIENLWLEVNSSSFGTGGASRPGHFRKEQVALQIDFKRNPLNRNLSHHLYYSWTGIEEGFPVFGDMNSVNTDYNVYGLITYSLRNRMPLRPYQINVGVDLHQDFDRLWIESELKLVYNANSRAVKTRFFFGSFAYNETFNPRYNFRMDGIGGPQDFRYDHVFPGRFDQYGFWAQQYAGGYGNFKVPTANGQSNDWLAALNLKLESPFRIPVGLYADFGITASQTTDRNGVLYNAGVYAWLIPDVVEIYFPVILAPAIRDERDTNGLKYWQLIRFMVNFNEINPFKLVKKIPA